MNDTRFISYISGLLAVGLIAVTLTVNAQSKKLPSARAIFSYSPHSEALIISYSATPEMLGNPDRAPRIQVFGDGRVLVHYPEYMKKAGDYEAYLNQGEIHQLLLALSSIFDFNPKAVKQSQTAITELRVLQDGILRYRSDDMLEKIAVQLDEYQESPGALVQNINLNLSWKNITSDAKDFPEVDALQKFVGARQSIRALLVRDDLVRVDAAPAD